jgi:hypothetical protein
MNSTLSTKIVALVLALAMNSVIMGSVAFLFNASAHAATLNVVSNVAHQIERSAA